MKKKTLSYILLDIVYFCREQEDNGIQYILTDILAIDGVIKKHERHGGFSNEFRTLAWSKDHAEVVEVVKNISERNNIKLFENI